MYLDYIQIMFEILSDNDIIKITKSKTDWFIVISMKIWTKEYYCKCFQEYEQSAISRIVKKHCYVDFSKVK